MPKLMGNYAKLVQDIHMHVHMLDFIHAGFHAGSQMGTPAELEGGRSLAVRASHFSSASMNSSWVPSMLSRISSIMSMRLVMGLRRGTSTSVHCQPSSMINSFGGVPPSDKVFSPS